MKILFVSLFLPQEKAYHAGGRYVFELIRRLSQRHEIHLATRLEDREIPSLELLRPFCKEIHPYTYASIEKRNLFDLFKLVFNYLGFSRYADRLVRDGNFDLVQVEWVETAIMIKRRKTPMVLDAHDVITKPVERAMKAGAGFGKAKGYLKYLLIRYFETHIIRKFSPVFTRSEYDKAYILSMKPDLDVKVIPHPAGLDITDRSMPREKNSILFFASYKYRRLNVDAALYFYREVFPLIRKAVPDARFIIAGYGPPEELTSIPSKDPGVTVTGFVDDMDELYKRASVFVAPILVGGGIIVKILDAMASGTPVVTTSYGNEGIGAKPGTDLLIADDPQTFAGCVLKFLADREYADKTAGCGRSFVKRNFGVDVVMEKIEKSYESLLKRHLRSNA